MDRETARPNFLARSEVGIYEKKNVKVRTQENTLSSKKAIKKEICERKKTRSRPRKQDKKLSFYFCFFLVFFYNSHLCDNSGIFARISKLLIQDNDSVLRLNVRER